MLDLPFSLFLLLLGGGLRTDELDTTTTTTIFQSFLIASPIEEPFPITTPEPTITEAFSLFLLLHYVLIIPVQLSTAEMAE